MVFTSVETSDGFLKFMLATKEAVQPAFERLMNSLLRTDSAPQPLAKLAAALDAIAAEVRTRFGLFMVLTLFLVIFPLNS